MSDKCNESCSSENDKNKDPMTSTVNQVSPSKDHKPCKKTATNNQW